MVQKRDKISINGRGFQEYRLQYKKSGPGGSTWSMHVFMLPCSPLKPSCEDILYKKATWLFLHYKMHVYCDNWPLVCSSEDWRKVLYFSLLLPDSISDTKRLTVTMMSVFSTSPRSWSAQTQECYQSCQLTLGKKANRRIISWNSSFSDEATVCGHLVQRSLS